MGMHMGTNRHAAERVKSDHTTPPPGPDRMTDQDHAMKAGAKAGKRGTSQRKSEVRKESPTRDEGRDDHRTGSDHHRH